MRPLRHLAYTTGLEPGREYEKVYEEAINYAMK